MDSTAAGVIGGVTVVLLIGVIAYWVLMIIARWKVFTKAGEPGWKSIIPIYSDYVQWRIGWKRTGLFWGYIAMVIIGAIMMSMGGLSGEAAVVTNPILAYGGLIVMLAGAIVQLVGVYRLFQSFGYGAGFLILYFFLPFIALMVLGFGSAQYQGARD